MVEWSDRFMMGIGDLDDDHQKLFAISKKLSTQFRRAATIPLYECLSSGKASDTCEGILTTMPNVKKPICVR